MNVDDPTWGQITLMVAGYATVTAIAYIFAEGFVAGLVFPLMCIMGEVLRRMRARKDEFIERFDRMEGEIDDGPIDPTPIDESFRRGFRE